MASNSGNTLIVNVVGDTSKLSKSLRQASGEINSFSATNARLGRSMNTLASAEGKAGRETEELHAHFRRTHIGALGLASGSLAVGAGLVIAAQAAHHAQQALTVTGDAAFTAGGKFRNTLAAAINLDVVGAFEALAAHAPAASEALKKLSHDAQTTAVDLRNFAHSTTEAAETTQANADAITVTTRAYSNFQVKAEANKKALEDQASGMRQAASDAKALASAMDTASQAVQDVNTKIALAGSDAAAFGERSGPFGRGIGAITREGQQPGAGLRFFEAPNGGKGLPGITQAQRNQFFDSALTRELGTVQDLGLQAQVTKLQQIAGIIQKRIDVTKDITRRLNLEDQLASVNRQRRGVQATIAGNESAAALAARARAQAIEQARQFRVLGLGPDGQQIVPGAANLRKQLSSLTDRLGSSQLAGKLDGARKLLSGKFGKLTEDTRKAIRDLFDTIRSEFDKGAKKLDSGSLTKTTSLNTAKILRGLGLSPEEERAVRARLSQFNSGGVGLPGGVGAFGVSINPVINLDGKKISTNTRNHNTVHAQRNPKQKRGA